MFKDKVYEELDDISKLIEPYQYSVNDDLSQFPDELEIDANTIDTRYLTTRHVVTLKARELGLKALADNCSEIDSKGFFKFKMLDEFNEPATSLKLDFKNGEINGKVILVKNKVAFDDDDVHAVCQNSATYYLMNLNWRIASSDRINEVADLFGLDSVKKEKSKRNKLHTLSSGIRQIIKDRKIDIRDVSLAKKFGRWLSLYIKDGNLPSLANLAKIKIMSHQNRPIYSIEEQGVE